MTMTQQALELNDAITATNPHVYDLLSQRGKAIYFPKKGILSQSAEAKGSRINATIGTALEDDGAPMAIHSLRALVNLPDAESFNYAPSLGRPEIRTIWKQMLARKNPLLAGATISLPVVTSALTHGLSMAGYLFTDPGDTVITPDLYWENYDLIFNTTWGATLSTFPMFNGENGFNCDGLRKQLMSGTPGKRIVLLNFPNNPTGYTVTEKEATCIRDILVEAANAGNTICIVVDDAYFGLVFEPGILRESMFGLLAGAHERILAVKLDGPTKEDYVWGFRVGFMTFGTARNSAALYAAMEAKLGGAIRGTISSSSNLGQTMLLSAYADEHYEREKTDKYKVLRRRYEKVRDHLASHLEYKKVFVPLPFNSGYFMCVKILSGNAEPVRKLLIKNYGTGVISQGECLRLAFSSTRLEDIETLLENIYCAALEVASN